MIGYKKKVDLAFLEAVRKVKEELKKEGFGVLTEIDVKATLKEKINVDFEEYIILGACNPEFAYEALKADKEVGLLLPCNVIVYSDNGEVFVEVINPVEALGVVGKEGLGEIAVKAKEKLEKAIDGVGNG